MKFPSTSLAILSSVTLSLAYNGPFRLVVGNANPDLHLKPITANDHQLEINGETTSYGSFDSVKLCPPGNEITFRGGDGSLSMNVAVSGGQFGE
jgi:hypothetical protein